MSDRPSLSPLRKVLMTADAVGGVWTYAMELARSLAPAEVVLATMGPAPDAAQQAEAQAIPNLELTTGDFRLEWMDDPWADVDAAGEWLLSLEAHHRPDLIHLNGYCHAALPWQAPCLVVAHSCVLSWWEAVKEGPAPSGWARYARKVAAGLRAADHIVAPSHAMLDSLRRHYGELPSSSVIANGREMPSATCDNKEPIILSAGRLWDEAKNTRVLAKAAEGLSWPVLLAGESGCSRSSGYDSVELLGKLSGADLAGWYARAAIYALPAKYEPFGLSALEAAQAGCALVLADIPSLRELWDGAAIFVPPSNPSLWQAALTELIRHPEVRSDLGRLASGRAGLYTAGRMKDAYIDLYHRILKSHQLRFAAAS